MPLQEFQIAALVRTLDEDRPLAEALFYPEICVYGKDTAAVERQLRSGLIKLLEKMPQAAFWQRRLPGPLELRKYEVELPPPRRSPAWSTPARLQFQAICWRHLDDAHLAFLPELSIEVLAGSAALLHERIPAEIRNALLRTKASGSLRSLTFLQRCQNLEIRNQTLEIELPSPKQLAKRQRAERNETKSVLAEVGDDMLKAARANTPSAYGVDDLLARLAEVLTANPPRSVLLVGPSGVGKTAATRELVRRRSDFNLAATPFWATSGSRLVAGLSGFGMWEERCQSLWREASKQRAILHLGNLVELMEVGKSECRGQGIATFLLPYIGRGELLCIVECTPEQLVLIERQDPHLLRVFTQIKVTEPSPEQCRSILTSVALASRAHGDLPIEPEALDTLDRLHRRYATYSAFPGRPLRFLKNLLADVDEKSPPVRSAELQFRDSDRDDSSAAHGTEVPYYELPGTEVLYYKPVGRAFPIRAADVTQAFSRETGLPLFLLEDSVRLDVDAARGWFDTRVIGQESAIDLVVNLLATVKAALARPKKPIASLLFIGPTGVGKTELAKSLAEFLFGDRGRMTRFDMSEYADPLAVQRLIGGTWEAEGLLTAKVREQPFGVILFDEFEKADASFFDLLLQMLGEGRLTDSAGRLADFCNAEVILTVCSGS